MAFKITDMVNEHSHITPFSHPAEQFLIDMLQCIPWGSKPGLQTLPDGFDWRMLQSAQYAWRSVYKSIQTHRISVPDWLTQALRQVYSETVILNENKLGMIYRLQQQFCAMQVDVLFVRDAAELVYNHQQTDFIASRKLKDIEFLCQPSAIDSIHNYLIRNGFDLDPYYQLENVYNGKHLVYNSGKWNQLRLHCYLTEARYANDYPPDFEIALWQNAQQITMNQQAVKVPALEHIVIYALCHAASTTVLKNNMRTIFDSAGDAWLAEKPAKPESFYHRLFYRFTVHQFIFLINLAVFLSSNHQLINWPMVQSTLASVRSRSVHYYAELAYAVLGTHCPLTQSQLDLSCAYFTTYSNDLIQQEANFIAMVSYTARKLLYKIKRFIAG